MADHFTRPDTRVPTRRLVAVGTITRRGGRTVTVRATPAGATGTIAPAVKR
ncbi:hypothetical protein [Streptomyces sp. 8L]|uniref:hypothetical protein n=1 Tax=Streptomyces sp. 8L TaxID=2877242 RepID=UPI001CD2B32E|nr:hypothetical protein [Streptomyces sp. 8L]MCA1218676.1 hypothetical protein [Streptomyces sp. 8L]